MRHYGLIGRKLGHSFSRSYFMDKFQREGIDADYTLIEIEDISAVIEVVNSDQLLHGLNVTIPYKQSIIPYLDLLSEEAESIGAVNCIAIKNGCLKGYNTDVEGIEATLNILDIESSSPALVFGTGGASKATSYVLSRRGIAHKIVSRSAGKGDITYDDLTADVISTHRLLINTTPLGMYPDIDSAPDIDYHAISSSHKVFDLVYNPEPTLFMRQCAKQGANVIGGSEMLRCQAEASWRIWSQS